MYKKIHVYDMDGVLVDTSHRYRNLPDGRIDLDYWLANRTEEKIAKDKLLPLAKQYIKDCLNPEIYTVICTSRQIHTLDLAFIVGRLGYPDKLIMREPGDNSHDAIYKRRELTRLFNLRQFKNLPRFFWDDNMTILRETSHLFNKVFHIPSRIAYHA